ncbi:unnamed protein product [Rotaria socialis]
MNIFHQKLESYINSIDVKKQTNYTIKNDMYLDILNVLKSQNVNQLSKFKSGNLPLIAHEKIYECHIAVGHSDRDKTWAEIKTRYAGIPQQAISIFIYMCDVCQTRRSFPKATSGKPIISIGFLTRLANIILNLKLNWPDLIITNGRPKYPQSQGLIERANAVVQKNYKETPYEMIFDQPARNDHDFWLQLHQQSINKTIIDEEDIPESLADNLNLNDHSVRINIHCLLFTNIQLYSFSKLIDSNSEYADSCSPIPILSSNTYVLQNNK